MYCKMLPCRQMSHADAGMHQNHIHVFFHVETDIHKGRILHTSGHVFTLLHQSGGDEAQAEAHLTFNKTADFCLQIYTHCCV